MKKKEVIQSLLAKGMSITEIAQKAKTTRGYVYTVKESLRPETPVASAFVSPFKVPTPSTEVSQLRAENEKLKALLGNVYVSRALNTSAA